MDLCIRVLKRKKGKQDKMTKVNRNWAKSKHESFIALNPKDNKSKRQ